MNTAQLKSFSSLSQQKKEEFLFDLMEEMDADPRLGAREMARRVNAEMARNFITHHTILRYRAEWLKNPSMAAFRDGRKGKKGKAKEPSPGLKVAYTFLRGMLHECSSDGRRFWLSAAVEDLRVKAPLLGISPKDTPSYFQAWRWFKREPLFLRESLGRTEKEIFARFSSATRRTQSYPNKTHRIDTIEFTFTCPETKENLTLHSHFQVDVASFCVRYPYWSIGEMDRRKIVHALKLGFLRAPQVGFSDNCIPSLITFDCASYQKKSFSLSVIRRDLMAREGQHCMIKFNPPKCPEANGSVERFNKEFRNRFVPKFQAAMRYAMEKVEGLTRKECLDRFERSLIQFVRDHNFGRSRRKTKTRIEEYLSEAPPKSCEITPEEIDQKILFYDENRKLGEFGIDYDGFNYDCDGLQLHIGKQFTVGVYPEGNSPYLSIYEGNQDDLRFVAKLLRTDLHPEIKAKKLAAYNKTRATLLEGNKEAAEIYNKAALERVMYFCL